MDAAALIADQHAPVDGGPPWLWNKILTGGGKKNKQLTLCRFVHFKPHEDIHPAASKTAQLLPSRITNANQARGLVARQRF